MQMQPHNCFFLLIHPFNKTVLFCEDSNKLNYNKSTYFLCSVSKELVRQSASDNRWLIRRLDSLTL